MQTTYRPGQWHLIVRPAALIALPPDTPHDVILTVWDRLAERVGLGDVIDALAAHTDGSFANLRPFAAVLAEGDGVRVAARGDVTLTVTDARDQSHSVSGGELTTWSERYVPAGVRVAVRLDEDAAGPALPMESGVARAAVADVALVESSADAADGSTAATADPAPAAEPAAPATPTATLLPAEMTYATPEPDFDQLHGATVHVPPKPATPPAAPLGDHDGETIAAAQLQAIRRPQPAVQDETPTMAIPTAPAGRIRVSTGQVVTLDRPVIIGRRPRATRATGANMPHLVAVESPQQDISRSHLEIRPEGDAVVVIDLHTTNGSTLLRPGADPVRLHPGEQTIVLSGDSVDLGDGVIVAFEDLP